MNDYVDAVFNRLQTEIDNLKRASSQASQQTERAEIADSIPAYVEASLPTLAGGGLGNGSAYITIAWCSDGRKPGEGAGMGTGILVVYDAVSGNWLNLDGYGAITT